MYIYIYIYIYMCVFIIHAKIYVLCSLLRVICIGNSWPNVHPASTLVLVDIQSF